MSEATLVLVHGAGGGSWCWEAVAEELDRLGIAHREVDLPSVGLAAAPDAGMRGDTVAVRALLDDLTGPVVLVGNSYGGVVISAAAVDHPGVARLVYVAAFMPEPGVPVVDQLVTTDEFMQAITMTEDGLGGLDPARAREIAHQQAEPAVAQWAATRMQPARMSDVVLELPAVAWQQIPSTYVVCTEDRCIPPEHQQRWASERATAKIEMPWDHVPSLSHPVELAEILAAITAGLTRSSGR